MAKLTEAEMDVKVKKILKLFTCLETAKVFDVSSASIGCGGHNFVLHSNDPDSFIAGLAREAVAFRDGLIDKMKKEYVKVIG